MLLDIPSGKIVDIPLLKTAIDSSEDDYFSDELISVLSPSSCGIHSIQCSPGNNKLATSGHNPNHLAIYTLPNLDPYVIGKVCKFTNKLSVVMRAKHRVTGTGYLPHSGWVTSCW